MGNWKGFEGCSLVFGVLCHDILADWEKLRILSQNRRWPCQDSKPVPPESALQFQGVIPTQSYLMSQCYNPTWQYVPYISRASPLHQVSRCHSVTTGTGRMRPTILERRPNTKLLDATVLQPEQAECALQFYSVAPTPSFSISQCYNRNCMLHILFSPTGREGCLLCSYILNFQNQF